MREDIITTLVSTLYDTKGDQEKWRGVAASHGATPEEIAEAFRRYAAIIDGAAPQQPKKTTQASPWFGSGIRLADTFLWLGAAFILAGALGFTFLDWGSLTTASRIAAVVLPNILLGVITLFAYKSDARYRYIAIITLILTWIMLPITTGVILSNCGTFIDFNLILALSFLIPFPLYLAGTLYVEPRTISLVFSALAAAAGGSALISYIALYGTSAYALQTTGVNLSYSTTQIIIATYLVIVSLVTWFAHRVKSSKSDSAFSRVALLLSALGFALSLPFLAFSLFVAYDFYDMPQQNSWPLAIVIPALSGLAIWLLYRKNNDRFAIGTAQRLIIIATGVALVTSGISNGTVGSTFSLPSLIYILVGTAIIVLGSFTQTRLTMIAGIFVTIVGGITIILPFIAALGTTLSFFIIGFLGVGMSAYVSRRHSDKPSTKDVHDDILMSDTTYSELQAHESVYSRLSVGKIILMLILGGILVSVLGSLIAEQRYRNTEIQFQQQQVSLSSFSWTEKAQNEISHVAAMTPIVDTVLTAPKTGYYSFLCTPYLKMADNKYALGSDTIRFAVNGVVQPASSSDYTSLYLTAGTSTITLLVDFTTGESIKDHAAACSVDSFSTDQPKDGYSPSQVTLYTKDTNTQTMGSGSTYSTTGDYTSQAGYQTTIGTSGDSVYYPSYIFTNNY